MSCRLALALSAAALVFPSIASAQAPGADQGIPPAYVARVDGGAALERDGRADTSPLNMPLLSGDRVRTTDGRVEVRFPDGSALFIDAGTTLDVQSDHLLRLIDGRVRISVRDAARSGTAGAIPSRIDSPAGSVRIAQPGEYRIALLHGPSTSLRAGNDEMQLELAVVRGSADIFTEEGDTPVRAGERAYASAGLLPSYSYPYNSAASDAFDQWSEGPRDVQAGASAQYLPPDMRTYASTFDEYGDWQYQQPYGYVWYPRVAADWHPYYYGRWMSYPRYGWTWIGLDRFAWPTHHYGRWGLSSGTWFWIPASRWAPAYVSWAYAPDYVSWCPLGWNNHAVFSLSVFNVGSGYYSAGPRFYSAWTVVAQRSFGHGFVHERAVGWDRLDRTRAAGFQERASAPALHDTAIARSATPIRATGTRSLPAG
ncbi:MAG TPA: DUF6600 domain-containing protein, partial [Vicinamibacterales bacterium]|nr:DUF6600 domain-containing protein [Vicinamibacterales bacterium]